MKRKNTFESRRLPDGDIGKGICRFPLLLFRIDRKCREIEICEFHQTLNGNIFGLGDPNLVKKFS